MFQLDEQEINEIRTIDHLSGEHVNKFGIILENNSKYDKPQNVNFMGLWEYLTPVTKPHIQILPSHESKYIGEVSHWTVFYYDGKIIHKYDSENTQSVTNSQETFLRRLFPWDPPIIFHNVQRQSNESDCGVFAIAYVVSICHKRRPETESYDIHVMREHLLRIFEEGKLLPFPSSPRFYSETITIRSGTTGIPNTSQTTTYASKTASKSSNQATIKVVFK